MSTLFRADRPLSARALTEMLGPWRRDSNGAAYAELATHIQLLVNEGRILAGTRLPAERPLAAALGLSRTTIVAAYGALRDNGYLISAQGSGSIITHGARTSASGLDSAGIDFSRAAPEAIPDLVQGFHNALSNLPAAYSAGNFDLIGLESLRTAIAERYTHRGLPTSPDDIVVTLGAQHAISSVARATLSRGDRALIEAPTYPHAAEALEAAGGRLVTIPVSPDGWDVEQAVDTIDRTLPTLGYLMPDFHNPTGASMPMDARAAILDAAECAGTVLIIDETTGEFAFSGEPVAPFATFASEDQQRQIVTIGSVGKTLWGGLRIGWIRANARLLRRILAIRPHGDLGTPALDQLLVAEYLPRMDEVIRERSRQFARAEQRIRAYVSREIPEWTIPETTGGICAWINLGAPVSSALAAAAYDRGLTITSGPRFGIDGAFESRIRIPFTAAPDDIDAGLEILRDAWRTVGALGAGRSPLLDTDEASICI